MAVFIKFTASWVGLGSARPCLVDRSRPRVRVSASFRKIPHLMGWFRVRASPRVSVASGVRVGASFKCSVAGYLRGEYARFGWRLFADFVVSYTALGEDGCSDRRANDGNRQCLGDYSVEFLAKLARIQISA